VVVKPLEVVCHYLCNSSGHIGAFVLEGDHIVYDNGVT
jgi:hypothetical protein